jgi:preprotein translocase subunit YajC
MPFSGPDLTLLLIAGAFLFLIFFNSRKRKNALAEMKSNMKVGATVIMAGGVRGKLTEIREDSVVVETTPGVKIEFLKGAVNRVVPPSLDEAKPVVKKTATTNAKTTSAPKASAPKTSSKKTAK